MEIQSEVRHWIGIADVRSEFVSMADVAALGNVVQGVRRLKRIAFTA